MLKFRLSERRLKKTNVHKIAGTALRDVELNGFEDFSVRELSGGMCRRVALARAIAFARSGLGRDAAILDEPLKGLDNAMKKSALFQGLLMRSRPALLLPMTKMKQSFLDAAR